MYVYHVYLVIPTKFFRLKNSNILNFLVININMCVHKSLIKHIYIFLYFKVFSFAITILVQKIKKIHSGTIFL